MIGSEKRRSVRRPCLRREVVADYDPERALERRDFHWVTFKDLSLHGVAFLTSHKPATSKVVIVLGKGPICIARVVRTQCRCESPEAIYEVGCEFERRLT